MLDALDLPEAGCRRCSSRRRCQRTGDGRLSPPAQATRRRRRSESVSTAPVPHRSCSAPRASCSRRSRRMPPSPRRGPHLLPRRAGRRGTRWASCSRLPARCAGFATPAPRESRTTPCSRRRRRPPGVDGLTFLPYLAARTPHADPDARGAFAGIDRHDRGALAGRARRRGVGLRDALEPAAIPGCRAGRRSGVGRRRARHAVVADRRVRARHLARADSGGGGLGTAQRCSAAPPWACSPAPSKPSRPACARARASSRSRPGSRLTSTSGALPIALSGSPRGGRG